MLPLPAERVTVLSGARWLFLLIAPVICSAQGNPPPSPTISVDVNLVVLHATVRDRAGGFVTGLPEERFHVFEDGRPQTIQVFQSSDVPVTVGLLVDSSRSMMSKRPDVTAAALAFVHSSNPEDEMFVVNFSDKASLGLSPPELFSASPSELENALIRAPVSGRTALYDALDMGLMHLRKGTRDKKVLIVISDGGDNASRHTLAQVLQAAERSDVIIYTIGLIDEDNADQNPGVLKRLARVTGGEAFFPAQTSELLDICTKIAADVRHQYTIGYAPKKSPDNTWRTIKVTATAPGRGRLSVRTREGYLALPPGGSPPGSSPEVPK
jgi:Ca-activated chloride channel homolog